MPEKPEKAKQDVVTEEEAEEARTETMLAEEKRKTTAKTLASQQKKTIYIEKDQLNPQQTHVDVWINGAHFKIERGKMVEVPLSVYEILKDGYVRSSSEMYPKGYNERIQA